MRRRCWLLTAATVVGLLICVSTALASKLVLSTAVAPPGSVWGIVIEQSATSTTENGQAALNEHIIIMTNQNPASSATLAQWSATNESVGVGAENHPNNDAIVILWWNTAAKATALNETSQCATAEQNYEAVPATPRHEAGDSAGPSFLMGSLFSATNTTTQHNLESGYPRST